MPEKVFYVVECVPYSESKRIYIKSAYIKKDSNGQELNVEEKFPQLTSETPLDGNAINDIVNEANQNVMTKGEQVERLSIDIDDIIDDPEQVKEVRLRGKLLKEQLEITDGTRRSVPKTRAFAKRLLKEYESSYSYADLSDDLIKLYEYVGQHTVSSTVSQKTLQDITERANAIAARRLKQILK